MIRTWTRTKNFYLVTFARCKGRFGQQTTGWSRLRDEIDAADWRHDSSSKEMPNFEVDLMEICDFYFFRRQSVGLYQTQRPHQDDGLEMFRERNETAARASRYCRQIRFDDDLHDDDGAADVFRRYCDRAWPNQKQELSQILTDTFIILRLHI